MQNWKEKFMQLFRDEEGASATEYAVLIVLIIVVALVAIAALGTQVERGFDHVATAIENAADSAGAN